MVAENDEKWYAGSTVSEDVLSLILEKDEAAPRDQPPLKPLPVCKLCSEARYEVKILLVFLNCLDSFTWARRLIIRVNYKFDTQKS